jgi:hypothetical protein
MVTSDRPPTLTPQVVVGLGLVLAGVIFTLDNLGLADPGVLVRFWPAIPILIGVVQVMHAREAREWVFATMWLGVGGVLLARNLGVLSFDLKDALPLLLVLVGIRIVLGRDPRHSAQRQHGRTAAEAAGLAHADRALEIERDVWQRFEHPVQPPPTPAADPPRPPVPPVPPTARPGGRLQLLAMMCGVERRIRGVFSGGDVSAIMGGCELDLRQATAAAATLHLNVFALWGGIEIRVPEGWTVLNESVALLGGVEDTTRDHGTPGSPRLVVRGMALMGGIEIKN